MLAKVRGLLGLLEKSCKRNYYTGLRRDAAGAPCPAGELRGRLGPAMGWSSLLLPQPRQEQLSPGVFPSCVSCPAPGLGFFAVPGPFRCHAMAPSCWGFGLKWGSAFGTLSSPWQGGAFGQHLRGPGCRRSVFVLWLLSGAASSCVKSGMCDAGAVRAGAMPRLFAVARFSRSRIELENEQSSSRSPHPSASLLVPGSFWSPGCPV